MPRGAPRAGRGARAGARRGAQAPGATRSSPTTPALEPPAPTAAPPAPSRRPTGRSLLVATQKLDALDPVLALATPLAAADPPHELIVAAVVAAPAIGDASAALPPRREALQKEGLVARTAAFTSPTPGEDLVRLASEPEVALLPRGGDDGYERVDAAGRAGTDHGKVRCFTPGPGASHARSPGDRLPGDALTRRDARCTDRR